MAVKKDKPERVGEVFPGQHWIELHGSFHPLELKAIALRLEKNIEKVRNGNKD